MAKIKVNIGVLIDGEGSQNKEMLNKLQQELSTVLGSKYRISIPTNKTLSANWSLVGAKKHYLKLVRDSEVDIIIAAGILTSSVVLQEETYRKPVIAIGVVDPLPQRLNPTSQGISGVKNLTYILFNHSLTNDLAEFHNLYPFQRVGIAVSEQLYEALLSRGASTQTSSFQKELQLLGFEYVWLPVKNSIADVLDNMDSVDAVYIGYIGRMEGGEKEKLISEVNKRKLPSFSPSTDSVERGVLASISPKRPVDKIVRRLVLNIEAILAGKNPSSLPVHLSFEEELTINMQTAREIDFSPKFSLLSEAVLMNELTTVGRPTLSLKDAVEAAIASNIELKVEGSKVKAAELEVDLAQTNYLPSLSLSSTGTQIDKERAAASFGQQAEKTVTNALKLEQLVFAESQVGGVEIQKYLLTAAQHNYQQLELDIVLNTATAFFDILRAKTSTKIQEENVNLFRQNLNLAKQREVAGYSGLSDVYHWESQLANSTTQYLSAFNNFKLTKIQLNQLLYRPLDMKFSPEDITMTKGGLSHYLTGMSQKYVDTPKALEKFTRFLVSEALINAPEIAELNASIRSQERRLTSLKRKRYLPSVTFAAEKKRVSSRSGKGSDVAGVDLEDDSWSASLNFSLPLFEGGAISVEAAQVSTVIMQLKDQRLQVQQLLEFRVRASLLGLVTQTVNLKSSRKAADFAAKQLILVQNAYRIGKASVVELSDAQNTSISSNQKALNSVYEFLTELLKTERAVGRFTILSDEEGQAAYISRLDDFFQPSSIQE